SFSSRPHQVRRCDGFRPVPRATRRVASGDADVCASLRLADRGGRSHRLVSAAHRDRDRSGGPRRDARRSGRGVQALQHGSRVPAATRAAVARGCSGDPVPDRRHRGARRGGGGGNFRGRIRRAGRARGWVARNPQPTGGLAMNHLLRSHAPISDAAWTLLDQEATERLSPALAARKLVDFSGPLGWEHSATNLGRTGPLTSTPSDGVTGLQRRVLPLVEVRADFELSRSELRDADRGAQDTDLDALDKAAHQIAIAENIAVFHGWHGAITGIAESTPHDQVSLGETVEGYTRHVAGAVERMLCDGIGGPYGMALGRHQYRRVVETAEHGGYPLLDHLRKILEGPMVWAPGVDGAVVVSLRGGDFLFESGQDLSIGYDSHDTDSVRLYLEESFSFRVATPEAAVVLTP